MRKSILLSTMLLVSTFAFAQIQKGQVQLGGFLSFNKSETGTAERTNFSFAPQGSYFISELTSIGISLAISSRDFKSLGDNFEHNLLEFGAFTRFHKSITDKLYFFLQPSLSLGSGKDGNDEFGSTDLNTTSIRISPGAMYFVTPKIAVEMAIGSAFYNSLKLTTGSNEVTHHDYGLSFNPANVNLGVSFFL